MRGGAGRHTRVVAAVWAFLVACVWLPCCGTDPGQLGAGGAGPMAPDGCATVRIRVRWPVSRVAARTLLSLCQTVTCTAGGSGIGEPVTVAITRPETTAEMLVPAGSGRQVAFEELDAGGAHMATSIYALPTLLAGEAYPITFDLLDDLEPNNAVAYATALPTEGTSSAWSILDSDDDADLVDWFRFEVTSAPNAYAFYVTDVASGGEGGLMMSIIGTDGGTVISDTYSAPPAALTTARQFEENGTYYVRVGAYGALATDLEYRIAISDSEGEAELSVTVD